MKVRYIGPHVDGVEVVAGGFAGQEAPRQHVKHGGVFETTREHAEQLLQQHDNWEAVKTTAKAKDEEVKP